MDRVKHFGTLAPVGINHKERKAALEKQIHELQNPNVDSNTDKTMAWTSYFALVFTAIGAFMPQTAAAAINGIQYLIG